MPRIDRAKDPRYVLISPVCRVVEIFVTICCRSASPLGPIFLYQNRSVRWRANFCPWFNRLVVLERWASSLKYRSLVEKFK